MDPWDAVLKIINEKMNIPIIDQDIGACHFLPGRHQRRAIIVRFIYDHHRELVWERKNSLQNVKNSQSGPIYIVERLTEADRKVMNYAKEANIRTKTSKGQVYVDFYDNKNHSPWTPVHKPEDVDKVIHSLNSSQMGRHFYAAPPSATHSYQGPSKMPDNVQMKDASGDQNNFERMFILLEKVIEKLDGGTSSSPPHKVRNQSISEIGTKN